MLQTLGLEAEEEEILNLPHTPSSSPEPAIGQLDHIETVRGSDLPRLHRTLDLIKKWPHPLPAYLVHPANAGSLPNPYSYSTEETPSRPLLQSTHPLLSHSLSGTFNVPRRAVEQTLQVASLTVRLGENFQFERFKIWYRREHPDASHEVRERLEAELDPSSHAMVAPRTLQSALRSLNVTQDLIIHPVCSDQQCLHIFYEIVRKEDFANRLPTLLCPSCDGPLRNSKQELLVLSFGRRDVSAELEAVMRVPGVENVIEKQSERKAKWDEEDATELRKGTEGYLRVLKEQDDGSMWNFRPRSSSLESEVLDITLNLAIDLRKLLHAQYKGWNFCFRATTQSRRPWILSVD